MKQLRLWFNEDSLRISAIRPLEKPPAELQIAHLTLVITFGVLTLRRKLGRKIFVDSLQSLINLLSLWPVAHF